MLPALLYLQFQQTRNRLVARLRRLRQPKYIFGALVGAAYLYFNFLRFFFLDARRRRVVAGAGAAAAFGLGAATWQGAVENAGALLLLTLAFLAWFLPNSRAALVFTEAEIAFLFPAPIRRRTLVQFRLLRAQLAILFSIALLTLVTGRFRDTGGAFGLTRQVVGWWVILSTVSLHALALSFARSLLLDRGVSNWRRRALTLLAAALLLGGALAWSWRALPSLADPVLSGLATASRDDARAAFFAALRAAGQALDAPPLCWVLWPFKLPLRPFLAADAPAFLRALGPALGLLALHYAFILRADVAFEEASIDASRRHALRLQVARAGDGSRARPRRRRRDPFPLRPTGVRAVALFWKNLLAAGGIFSLRTLVLATALLLAAAFGLGSALGRGRGGGAVPLVGLLALEFLCMSALFGSQLARNDLRQDLANVDLLKTYPLPGWQIVLGELLAPAALLTTLQWLLLGVTVACFQGDSFGGHGTSLAPRLRLALAAALVAPPFNLLSLTVPNAAVLLLPGWFQRGPQAPQGVEVMGQRLIFFFGQFFVLAVALTPAGVVGAAVYFACRILGWSDSVALLLAPLATALVLAGEVALALFPLGRWLEGFDVSKENDR